MPSDPAGYNLLEEVIMPTFVHHLDDGEPDWKSAYYDLKNQYDTVHKWWVEATKLINEQSAQLDTIRKAVEPQLRPPNHGSWF